MAITLPLQMSVIRGRVSTGIRRPTAEWLKLFVASLLAVLQGCIAVPVPADSVTVSGRSFVDEDLGFLERGQTAWNEVSAELGPPLLWLPRQNLAVYGVVRGENTALLIGTVGSGDLTVWRGLEREALFVALDDDNLVVDWGRSAVDQGNTWLGAALQWGNERALDLPQPRDGFVLETPDPNQSLVYIYRPRKRFLSGSLVLDVYGRRLALLTQLRSQSYSAARLEPGTRQIVVSAVVDSGSVTSLARTILLDLEPGLTYFVDVDVESGQGQIEPMIVERTREEAIPVLESLRETW